MPLCFTGLLGCGEHKAAPKLYWPDQTTEINAEDGYQLLHTEAELGWGRYLDNSKPANDTIGDLLPNIAPLWAFQLVINGVPVQEKWIPDNSDAVATAYCQRSSIVDPGQLVIVYHTGSNRPDSIALTFLRFHEFGHLRLEHATCAAGSRPSIERELAADIFATQMLCALPGGIDVIRHSSGWFSGLNIPESTTHPASRVRAKVILQSCKPS